MLQKLPYTVHFTHTYQVHRNSMSMYALICSWVLTFTMKSKIACGIALSNRKDFPYLNVYNCAIMDPKIARERLRVREIRYLNQNCISCLNCQELGELMVEHLLSRWMFTLSESFFQRNFVNKEVIISPEFICNKNGNENRHWDIKVYISLECANIWFYFLQYHDHEGFPLEIA